ncbi:hypothetical protein GBAR_LOCUS24728 [Geodia barretti]|uniref:Uncharacterized protein n=1 Tax=Geodia barretti TaxID=519541 RepID=A0AA35X419_GEOBA|nr:hypothetical protein GBAR_LOCUS24728 [Geodia barretti]
MIVQQLSRTWERRMFLPQFLCKWAEPTNVATLHNSRSSRGSGSEANDDNYSGHIDTVGPPDPVSNIRPLRLREPSSADEKELQKLKFQMWALKHHFWTQHNTQFKQVPFNPHCDIGTVVV